MKETQGKFETVRHGDKRGEDLSETGITQAKEKAHQLYEEIRSSPGGSVFYVMPSNVGRAVETRNVIESELQSLVQEEDAIEIISVQDLERIKQAKGDKEKKYVISEIQPSTALGFNENTPSLAAFLKYKDLYKGNEDFIGMTWAAGREEMPGLRERIEGAISGLDVSGLSPADFQETPEEAAMKYIRLMQRMSEVTEKYFPGHPWKGLQVGHNLSADFAAMALLGKDISIENIDALGGQFRMFLESSHLEIQGDKIVTRYRGAEVTQEKDLKQVIEDLSAASEKRKKEWQEMSPVR